MPSLNAVKENLPHFPGSINPPSDQEFCLCHLFSTSSSTNSFNHAALIHEALNAVAHISTDCRTCHEELVGSSYAAQFCGRYLDGLSPVALALGGLILGLCSRESVVAVVPICRRCSARGQLRCP